MIEYRTKVDILYDIIIKKISDGTYSPNERLVISQISKENRVSDIPVREAIRRLESEGYVYINANQGAVVSEFTVERLAEIFQIKAVLEGYAARLSIDYLSESDIDKLRDDNKKLQQALENNKVEEYAKLNMDFHLRMYQSLPQKELYGLICDLWKKHSITKKVFSLSPDSMKDSIREHEEIIELICAKDYDNLEHMLRVHKMRAGTDLTKRLCFEEKK